MKVSKTNTKGSGGSRCWSESKSLGITAMCAWGRFGTHNNEKLRKHANLRAVSSATFRDLHQIRSQIHLQKQKPYTSRLQPQHKKFYRLRLQHIVFYQPISTPISTLIIYMQVTYWQLPQILQRIILAEFKSVNCSIKCLGLPSLPFHGTNACIKNPLCYEKFADYNYKLLATQI